VSAIQAETSAAVRMIQEIVSAIVAAAAAVSEAASSARDLEEAVRTLRGRSADLARDGSALKVGIDGFLARIRAA
jgi:hypothetical protein